MKKSMRAMVLLGAVSAVTTLPLVAISCFKSSGISSDVKNQFYDNAKLLYLANKALPLKDLQDYKKIMFIEGKGVKEDYVIKEIIASHQVKDSWFFAILVSDSSGSNSFIVHVEFPERENNFLEGKFISASEYNLAVLGKVKLNKEFLKFQNSLKFKYNKTLNADALFNEKNVTIEKNKLLNKFDYKLVYQNSHPDDQFVLAIYQFKAKGESDIFNVFVKFPFAEKQSLASVISDENEIENQVHTRERLLAEFMRTAKFSFWSNALTELRINDYEFKLSGVNISANYSFKAKSVQNIQGKIFVQFEITDFVRQKLFDCWVKFEHDSESKKYLGEFITLNEYIASQIVESNFVNDFAKNASIVKSGNDFRLVGDADFISKYTISKHESIGLNESKGFEIQKFIIVDKKDPTSKFNIFLRFLNDSTPGIFVSPDEYFEANRKHDIKFENDEIQKYLQNAKFKYKGKLSDNDSFDIKKMQLVGNYDYNVIRVKYTDNNEVIAEIDINLKNDYQPLIKYVSYVKFSYAETESDGVILNNEVEFKKAYTAIEEKLHDQFVKNTRFRYNSNVNDSKFNERNLVFINRAEFDFEVKEIYINRTENSTSLLLKLAILNLEKTKKLFDIYLQLDNSDLNPISVGQFYKQIKEKKYQIFDFNPAFKEYNTFKYKDIFPNNTNLMLKMIDPTKLVLSGKDEKEYEYEVVWVYYNKDNSLELDNSFNNAYLMKVKLTSKLDRSNTFELFLKFNSNSEENSAEYVDENVINKHLSLEKKLFYKDQIKFRYPNVEHTGRLDYLIELIGSSYEINDSFEIYYFPILKKRGLDHFLVKYEIGSLNTSYKIFVNAKFTYNDKKGDNELSYAEIVSDDEFDNF
ncbi:hypothetical protein [Mycoplasma phocoeninasale]|uniref:hypothetical protein n=1 Tax=Mycoplasma phocoeninasale TaxID=2726117 RepID=UPI00196871BA|nr:hypothetical protein [Mycoplasma phocoeninasale]MBN0970438.1 hypothetical protein [Mycoplasma phocoeninasale]